MVTDAPRRTAECRTSRAARRTSDSERHQWSVCVRQYGRRNVALRKRPLRLSVKQRQIRFLSDHDSRIRQSEDLPRSIRDLFDCTFQGTDFYLPVDFTVQRDRQLIIAGPGFFADVWASVLIAIPNSPSATERGN